METTPFLKIDIEYRAIDKTGENTGSRRLNDICIWYKIIFEITGRITDLNMWKLTFGKRYWCIPSLYNTPLCIPSSNPTPSMSKAKERQGVVLLCELVKELWGAV